MDVFTGRYDRDKMQLHVSGKRKKLPSEVWLVMNAVTTVTVICSFNVKEPVKSCFHDPG